MGVEEGYGRFACDRSGAAHRSGKATEEFLAQDDVKRKEWTTVSHIDELGVPVTLTLCPECQEKYHSVKETWDRDFREFAEEGF